MGEIIFITGTDTGVGKTVLTALLLAHLRGRNVHALAMKPFCSGGRRDVKILQRLQPGELSDSELNPFYFEEPVAPYVAAQKSGIVIEPEDVLEKIARVKSRCDLLLIEGAGGLMVPLGRNFLIRDLIVMLQPRVFLVGRNKLGALNHTMLSMYSMETALVNELTIVLMSEETADNASKSNVETLREFVTTIRVFLLPFLGKKLMRPSAISEAEKKLKKTLAAIVQSV